MRTEISIIEIHNEMDLVLTHRRAMQLCRFLGSSLADQTRFATAVSEICRNCLVYCGWGKITYNIIKVGEAYKFETTIVDKGSGIKGLDVILKRDPQIYKGRGLGIVFARKLADGFIINSTADGTTVVLEKFIPFNAVPINNLIIKGWIMHIKNEPAISAYEELKNRNDQLIQLTEELKMEKLKVDGQMDQIKTLNSTLENNNAYMQQFTYTVSHDLKTPLTSLKLALGFLDEEGDEKLNNDYIGIIARAARKLEKTINGMVEILDLQSRDKQIAQKINFADELKEIVEQVSNQYSITAIDPDTDFKKAKEILYIPGYITSILLNLMSNAIKYRSANRKLDISIKTAKQDNYIILTFSDNGEGIDLVKHGSKLFSPFIRLNESSEGKGIGLYIVKSMVEKNGGRIQVDSVPGKGTTFRIYLKEYGPSPGLIC